jgi:Tfp pilus assembly protein PilF
MTNLAGLLQKSDNIAQAQIQYMKVLQIEPANPEANYGLAVIYEKQGEKTKAVDHYQKFLASGAHREVAGDVEKKIEALTKKE